MTYYTSIIVITWIGLMILGILMFENDRIRKEDKKKYYLSYGLIAAAALFEWVGVQISGNQNISQWILRIVKCGDYILTPIAGGFLVFQLKNSSRFRKILMGLLGLNTVFQVISCFTGWTVTIDGNNNYSHGPLYFFYALIYLSIIILVVIEFRAYSRRFVNSNRASLYGILLLVLIGIGIQEITSGSIRLSYLSMMLGTVLLFIHTTEFFLLDADRLLSTDELTGLLNRHAYRNDLKEIEKAGKLPAGLTVFMIDINNLKVINDQSGHDAGDELIRGAARCIEDTFNTKGKCYRIGGDEFVILAEMNKEQADKSLMQLFHRSGSWKGSLVDEMSLACGYAFASDHENDTVEQLIKEADRAMYAAKSEYYRRSGKDRRRSRD